MIIGQLQNPVSGQIRDAHVGFSWTMLLFGSFVPLVRGDWKWFFITALLALLTFGISWLVFPFLYNGMYTRGLIKDGFKARNAATAQLLGPRLGLIVPILS